jgi:hypothetical protein
MKLAVKLTSKQRTALALVLIIKNCTKSQLRQCGARHIWVKQWIANRYCQGVYFNLFHQLEDDMAVSKTTYVCRLSKVGPLIRSTKYKSTAGNQSLRATCSGAEMI